VCARILEDLEGLLAALLDVVANFTLHTAAVAAEVCNADFCDTARYDTDRCSVACELCVACFLLLVALLCTLLISTMLLVAFFDNIGVFLCLSVSIFQKCMQPTE